MVKSLLVGAAMIAAAVATSPFVAQAQAITCAPGTMVLQRAVGSPSAPMLVPMQVHTTVCSQNGTPIAVVPSIRTVGPSSAPLVVPVQNGVTQCVPSTVASVPVVGGGPSAPLQVVQSGSSVVTTSGGSTLVVTPTQLTCF